MGLGSNLEKIGKIWGEKAQIAGSDLESLMVSFHAQRGAYLSTLHAPLFSPTQECLPLSAHLPTHVLKSPSIYLIPNSSQAFFHNAVGAVQASLLVTLTQRVH